MACVSLITLLSFMVVTSTAHYFDHAIIFRSRNINRSCNCIPLGDCDMLRDNFETARREGLGIAYGEFVKKHHCGFYYTSPKVCCPLVKNFHEYKNFYQTHFIHNFVNNYRYLHGFLQQFLPKPLMPQINNVQNNVIDEMDDVVNTLAKQFLPKPSIPQIHNDQNNFNNEIDDAANTLPNTPKPQINDVNDEMDDVADKLAHQLLSLPPIEQTDSGKYPNEPASQNGADTSMHIELNTKCGQVSYRKTMTENNSEIADFPWLVLLEYITDEGKKFLCGGSLITDQVVLTAARCVESQLNELVSVRLGDYAPKGPIDCKYNAISRKYECVKSSIDIGIESIHPHEDYYNGVTTRMSDEKYRRHDVALIKLRQKVNFTDHVQPICLPTRPAPKGEKFVIAGWGRSMTHAKNEMRRGAMSIVKKVDSACDLFNVNRNEYVCVDDEPHVEDDNAICVSDGGGPIMAPELKNDGVSRFTLYGLSNLDLSCTEKLSKYGLYTRINQYVPWINRKLKEIL